MIIRVDIEAETQEEYQKALETLCAGLQQESIDVAVDAATVAKKTAKAVKKQKAVSTDSTSDTEPSKTGEQPERAKKEPVIEPETAEKTRYFMHKPNNKTFVIKKGEGIPVEAVHYGDAVEMTKAEYDEFNGKKAEKEPVEESKAVTEKDVKQAMLKALEDEDEELPTKDEMIALIRQGMDKKKQKEIKALFGEFGAEKFPGIDEKDYPALKVELEKLVK